MTIDPTPRAVAVSLTVIRKSDTWLAVDKPSGLLSVPGRVQHDCVVNRIRAAYPLTTGPVAPHRLDMHTSGVMLCALNPDSHRNLSLQFERREVTKHYLALLAKPTDRDLPAEGTIDLPMRLDVDRRPIQIIDREQGRPAQTRYRILDERTHTTPDGSPIPALLVEFQPITGRSHQLRLHAAHPEGLGAPILGDDLYADAHARSANRLMLHATSIAFTDPDTNEPTEVTSPAPFTTI